VKEYVLKREEEREIMIRKKEKERKKGKEQKNKKKHSENKIAQYIRTQKIDRDR